MIDPPRTEDAARAAIIGRAARALSISQGRDGFGLRYHSRPTAAHRLPTLSSSCSRSGPVAPSVQCAAVRHLSPKGATLGPLVATLHHITGGARAATRQRVAGHAAAPSCAYAALPCLPETAAPSPCSPCSHAVIRAPQGRCYGAAALHAPRSQQQQQQPGPASPHNLGSSLLLKP